MKIQQIQFRAFRSYVGQALSLDASRVILGGVNAVGKSSIREGIRFCLTGSAKDADGIDLPGESLAPAFLGVAEAAASVVLEGIGRVERQWTPGTYQLRVSSFTGTPTVQQQALYDALGTTEATVHAVIDSRHFLRLPHAKGKALIMGLLNVTVPVEDRVYTLDDLDGAYKQAFEDRKVAKIRAKDHRLPPDPGPSPVKMAVPEIEERLRVRRQQLDEALKAVGATLGSRRALEQRRSSAQANCLPILPDAVYVAGLKQQIAELEERLAIMEAEVVPAMVAAFPMAVIDAAVVKDRIVRLKAHVPENGCVLDPSVPCETAKRHFTKAVKALQADVEAAQPALPTGPAPTNPLTDMRRQLQAFKNQLAEIEKDLAERTRMTSEVEALTAELSSLPDTSEAEQAVATLREQIQKGEALLAQAIQHQKAVSASQDAARTHQALVADVERLEGRCTLLGPTGARVGALAAALGGFEAKVNTVTGAYGWTFALQVEPWQVVANGRPVQTYSWSEQYRIGIALQLAIAELSGLHFAVVDELDLLDAANRKILFQMLYASPVAQILMLATREPDVPLPAQRDGSPLPETICYRLGLKDSRSLVVEQVPA